MCWTNRHIQWLTDTGQQLQTADGFDVPVFEFRYRNDPAILSAWAKHFRNHYCADDELDALRVGDDLSRRDYLLQVKFPDGATAPGPSTRAGDFGEILVADYVQYVLNYTVPRTRYCWKINRNESPQGVDVMGFKMASANPSPDDQLITFEVKCSLSHQNGTTLARALSDSQKDYRYRKAESLNAMCQRLRLMKQGDQQQLVSRFQKGVSTPYHETTGAAAIHSSETFCSDVATSAIVEGHPNTEHLALLIIHGRELMRLAHTLYQRAADDT